MVKTVATTVENTLEIKRSKFITVLKRCHSETEAKAFLDMVRKTYPEASHYCFGYIFGEHQEVQRYDDDGEPSQTAGMPILEVLKKQDLTDVLCVVVRYFGGVKLGGGGLIRAYAKSASEAVEKAVFKYRTRLIQTRLTMSYSLANSLEEWLRKTGIVNDITYQAQVVFTIDFGCDDWNSIKAQLINQSRNTMLIEELGETIAYQSRSSF